MFILVVGADDLHKLHCRLAGFRLNWVKKLYVVVPNLSHDERERLISPLALFRSVTRCYRSGILYQSHRFVCAYLPADGS